MSHPRIAAIAACLLVVITGCLSSEDERGRGKSGYSGCEDSAISAEGCAPPRSVYAGGSHNITVSGCTRHSQVFITHRTLYSPQYPEKVSAINPELGLETGALHLVTCKQAIGPGYVSPSFQVAYFFSAIRPPEPRVPDTTRHSFVFQTYSNDPRFVEVAAANGLNVALVETIPIAEAPLAEERSSVQFRIPRSGPDYSVTGFHAAADTDVKETHALFYMNGTSLALLKFRFEGRLAFSSGDGMMEFGPSSYWVKHSRLPRIVGPNNYETNVAGTFSFETFGS